MPVCGGSPEVKYILLENSNKIELEDGSGYLLLEDQDIGKTSSPWKSKGAAFLVFAIGELVWQLFDKG